MKSRFEDFIKQSAEQYDAVEYNPAHWDRIEKELNGNKKSNLKYYIGGALLAGAIATALLTGGEETRQTATAVKADPHTPVQTTGTATQPPLTKSSKTTSAPVQEMARMEPGTIAPVSVPSATPALVLPPAPKNEPPVPAVVTRKVTEAGMTASIKVNKTNGCASEGFYFTADVNVPATYQWTFGDGKTSDLPSPSHSYAQAGKYGVNLKLTSLIDGKTIRITEGTVISVNPKPTARFKYAVDEDANFSRVVELSNTSAGSIGSQWIVDGKFFNEEEPRIKINRKGSYPVSLIIKNDVGCYDTLVQNVVADKDYNLLAPNAFTPNDDNNNDDFLPEAIRHSDIAFKMDIIDPKTGSVIFTTTKQPWDGLNNNTGRRCDNGTYLWMVTLTRKDNSKEVFKGNVSIIK